MFVGIYEDVQSFATRSARGGGLTNARAQCIPAEIDQLRATAVEKAVGNVSGMAYVGLLLNPNPPMDTDGRREDSGRGVRELQAR